MTFLLELGCVLMFTDVQAIPLNGGLQERWPRVRLSGYIRLITGGMACLCISWMLFRPSRWARAPEDLDTDVASAMLLASVSAGDGMPDVFCFTVMGQPAVEQALLLAQKSRGKGIFQCPGDGVFAHDKVPPVTHPLPKLNFGVAKGGKWGNALNTPIFKEIWQKAGCVFGKVILVQLMYFWNVQTSILKYWLHFNSSEPEGPKIMQSPNFQTQTRCISTYLNRKGLFFLHLVQSQFCIV